MLAVVFLCMRFSHYLYGQEFTFQGDHKPLEDIYLKHLSAAPSRLQGLLPKFQPFDFVIKYVLGIRKPMGNVLSKVNPQEKGEIKGLDHSIDELTPHLTRVHIEQIQKATQGDKTLQLLIQQMLK